MRLGMVSHTQPSWKPKQEIAMSLISKVTQPTKQSTTRTRTKPTQVFKQKGPTDEMMALASEFFDLNSKANDAKRKADKAREALFRLMKGDDIKMFTHVHQTEVGPLTLKSEIKSTTRNVIDVDALASLVTPSDFIKMVSATQKSVTENAGSDVLARCLKEQTGEENVSISTVK